MPGSHGTRAARFALAALLALPFCSGQAPAGTRPAELSPAGEVLRYSVEWRLIHAGNARLTWAPASPDNGRREASLQLESVGLVSRLYRVRNSYTTTIADGFCSTGTLLKAEEGRRRRETLVTFDREQGKASYLERDLTKNAAVSTKEIEIPPCVHDVIGALLWLRTTRVPPGESIQVPISDGKKSVSARVEAQQRERVKTPAGAFETIRYEAFLFNGVLYGRKGHLYAWLTDDERRLPVQIRARLQFHVGTITFQLEKEERP